MNFKAEQRGEIRHVEGKERKAHACFLAVVLFFVFFFASPCLQFIFIDIVLYFFLVYRDFHVLLTTSRALNVFLL